MVSRYLPATIGVLAGSLGAAGCDLLAGSDGTPLPVEFTITAPGSTEVAVGPNLITITGQITLGGPCYDLEASAVRKDGEIRASVRSYRTTDACFHVEVDRGYRLTITSLSSGRTPLKLHHDFLRDNGHVSSYPILDTAVVVPDVAAHH